MTKPKPKPEAVAAGNISLAELGPGQCRWPHGDRPPFVFCGAPVVEGRPYCPEHIKRMYAGRTARDDMRNGR